MAETLPDFPYDADPLADGRFEERVITCEVCGQRRGWAYVGGMYAVEKPSQLCPWCAADGYAAAKYQGHFQDVDFPGDPSEESRNAVLTRTPSVVLWNPILWPDHCGECCTYMGTLSPAEQAEITAQESVQREAAELARSISSSWAAQVVLECADQGTLTLHLFQCARCGTYRLSLDGT